jgi:hypothetical protein
MIDCYFTVRKYVSTEALESRPRPNSQSLVDTDSLSLAYLNDKYSNHYQNIRRNLPFKEIGHYTRPKGNISKPFIQQVNNFW